MKTVKNFFTRLFLLNKRLLKKASFLLILCLIPILTVSMTLLAREESGVLKILLYSQDEDSVVANEIIDKLLHDDNIISFEKTDDAERAYELVTLGKADALWIFKKDIQDKIDGFARGANDSAIVTVIERETDISLQLSHEKLAGVIFPYISYSIFDHFLYTEIFTADEITKEQVREAYDKAIGGGDLVAFETVSGEKKEENANYLTAPLRGLLSLVVILCGLAAVMYHQSDRENRTYDWLARTKHISFGFFTCFSAVFDAAVFTVIALIISGLYTGIYEILSALLFTFATTAFCLIIGVFTRRSSVTGKTIPFLMIILLVSSPIFFNLGSIAKLQMLLPTYYYLYSVYDPIYIAYMFGYTAISFIILLILNKITEKNV